MVSSSRFNCDRYGSNSAHVSMPWFLSVAQRYYGNISGYNIDSAAESSNAAFEPLEPGKQLLCSVAGNAVYCGAS